MALKCLATYPNMAIYGGQIVIIPHILAPPAGPPAVFYGGFEPSPAFRRHNHLIRRNMLTYNKVEFPKEKNPEQAGERSLPTLANTARCSFNPTYELTKCVPPAA